MEKFLIQCTEWQTRKAMELGAPIMTSRDFDDLVNREYFVDRIEGHCVVIPTSEEMIGWLEHNTLFKCIQVNIDTNPTNWMYAIYYGKDGCIALDRFSSRKEATLAAIDAALECLSNVN